MPTPTPPPFGGPPPPSRRAARARSGWVWLRAAARKARNNPRRTAAHVVALGRLLLDVRARLGRGGFGRWLDTAGLNFSRRTAERAMTAARRVAHVGGLAHLTPSALEVLARRAVAADPDLVERVLAAEGRRGKVGLAAAKDAVTDVRPDAVYDLAAAHRAEETEAEALARRLLCLAIRDGVSALMVSIDSDPDCPTAEVVVMGDRREVFTKPTLHLALAAAVGEERRRRCPKCKDDLPEQMFSKSAHACKFCERKRVRAYTAAKRARQAKVASEPSPPAPG